MDQPPNRPKSKWEAINDWKKEKEQNGEWIKGYVSPRGPCAAMVNGGRGPRAPEQKQQINRNEEEDMFKELRAARGEPA